MRLRGWVLAIFLGGCTVHSGQLTALRGLLAPAASPPQYWQASYGGEVVAVLPVLGDQGIVFADVEGHTYVFDGWTVRYASTPAQRRPVIITAEPEGRRYRMGRRSRFDPCGPWEQQAREAALGMRWRQICNNGRRYENIIDVDSAGQIERIDQVIDLDGGRLLLWKPPEDKGFK